MADDVLLNPGTGPGSVRALDRKGTGAPVTEVHSVDAGGAAPGRERIVSPVLPFPVEALLSGLVDPDGILYINPFAPSADPSTGARQSDLIDAVNGKPLAPLDPDSANIGVKSGAVLGANAGRRGLKLTNTSTGGQAFSLNLKGGAAVLYSGMTLYPGDVWNMDRNDFTAGAINGIASATGGTAGIQEWI
ncbi:MAG: hypothetical protein ACRETH_10690 [Steroidobacteraceae bacterium]